MNWGIIVSKYIIKNKSMLNGNVDISGSKNSALPILCASVLCAGVSEFTNIPRLSDIEVMTDILKIIGCKIQWDENSYTVDSMDASDNEVPFEYAGKIRASFLISGPLLARFNKVRISLPGGCAIGSRPVDLHIKGLKALGADCEISDGYVTLTCTKLTGNHIYLDFPSVGATQNILMASTLAEGTTVIENCASEPEICDLISYLNKCGAKIYGSGTDKLTIIGVSSLRGCKYAVIPDRIEAGTYMIATAAAGGNVRLLNTDCSHLSSVISKLKEVGVQITEFGSELSISSDGIMNPTDIKTLPFPGFPTDMQAQFAALLCNVKGTSVITETVFENRFMYIPELVRMNADIKLDGRTAVISGKGGLIGARVKSTDLRAGAALVIAGLSAQGNTVVEDDENYIKRGYSELVNKFKKLGASIEEVL